MSTNNIASQEATEVRRIPNAEPSGLMVRVLNPNKPKGADIYCENLAFKEEFKLDAGSYVDCDMEMAKIAKRNWDFLRITDIDEEVEAVEQGALSPTQKINLMRYTYQQKARMLKMLALSERGMKETRMNDILSDLRYDEVFKAVQKAQLPVYLISRF